jgi:hypothetical protein
VVDAIRHHDDTLCRHPSQPYDFRTGEFGDRYDAPDIKHELPLPSREMRLIVKTREIRHIMQRKYGALEGKSWDHRKPVKVEKLKARKEGPSRERGKNPGCLPGGQS